MIAQFFEESKSRFGAEKIRIKLLECGKRVSRKHISALMKEMGLVCKQAQLKYFNTTNRKYVFRKNHILQKFQADLPNVLWVSDITYIRVNSVFHALCVIIDIFSRFAFYFNGHTWFSKHTRNNFKEFRKTALNSDNPDLKALANAPEEWEHRETYSLGAGLYLGKSKYYGWTISKHKIFKESDLDNYYLYAGYEEGFCVK